MTSTGEDAESQGATPENPYPGYCADHAAAAAKYGWSFTPFRFPGCPDCAKPDDFEVKTQPHLAAAEKKEN